VVDPNGILVDFAGTGDRTAPTNTLTNNGGGGYGEFDPGFSARSGANCSGVALPPVPACGPVGRGQDAPDQPGARFDRPNGLAVGDDGSVYVADLNEHVVRRIMSREVTQNLFNLNKASDQLPKLTDLWNRPVYRVMTVAGVKKQIGGDTVTAGVGLPNNQIPTKAGEPPGSVKFIAQYSARNDRERIRRPGARNIQSRGASR